MHKQTNLDLSEDVVVAESPLLRRECKNRYGGVEGLDDSELANPDELERQVYREELAPILALPIQGHRFSKRVAIDEDGLGRGSARSTDTFDMVAALGACREHLVRFGGHATAAGLAVREDHRYRHRHLPFEAAGEHLEHELLVEGRAV